MHIWHNLTGQLNYFLFFPNLPLSIVVFFFFHTQHLGPIHLSFNHLLSISLFSYFSNEISFYCRRRSTQFSRGNRNNHQWRWKQSRPKSSRNSRVSIVAMSTHHCRNSKMIGVEKDILRDIETKKENCEKEDGRGR